MATFPGLFEVGLLRITGFMSPAPLITEGAGDHSGKSQDTRHMNPTEHSAHPPLSYCCPRLTLPARGKPEFEIGE